MESTTEKSEDRINVPLAGKLAILMSGFVPGFAQGGLVPVLPIIALHFANVPGAPTLVRMLISIVGVTVVIGAPITGILADRYGRQRVLLIGLIAFGIMGAAGCFIDNIYGILATRLLVGAATAAVGASMLTIIATKTAGTARNRWLGYLQVSGGASALIFFPLVGWLGNLGWRWPFLLHAATLPMAALVLFGFTNERAPAVPPADAQTPSTRASTVAALPWKFIAFALLTGIIATTTAGLFVPFHFQDIGVIDPRLMSESMLVASLVSASAAMLYPVVRKFLSISTTFVAGFALFAISHLLMGLGQSFMAIAIGQSINGIGIGTVITNAYALAAITGSDAHRARTMGCAKACLYIGPSLGQILVEPIVSHSDAGTGLVALGLFAAALSVACLVYALSVGRKPATAVVG